MARRQASEEFDPFDDDLFGGDSDRVDINDLRLEVDNLDFGDDDDDDLPASTTSGRRRRFGFGRNRAERAEADSLEDEAAEPAPRAKRARPKKPARPPVASTRPPLRPAQVIVGALQVIVYALVAAALFLAIGFGVVFAGQQLGMIPDGTISRSPSAIGESSGGGSSVAGAPTIAPSEQPVIVPTNPPTPTPTVDPACPSAVDWWNSQQIQDNYSYFTTKALDDARGSNRIPALVEQMNIRRDFAANFRLANGESPCLDPLRADLVRAFDATIAAVRVINSDEASAATQQANADAAYNDLVTALRGFGVPVEMPTSGA